MGGCGGCVHNVLSLLGASICLIIFNILIVLKVDGGRDLPWYYVFIPIWVGYIFYSWFVLCVFFVQSRKAIDLGAGLWLEAAGFCFILWTILLSVKLEVTSWSGVNWAWIFVPYWIGCFQLLLIDNDWPVYKHHFHRKPNKFWKRYHQILPRNVILAVMLFGLIMVLLGQDVITHGNWGLYFTPFWFVFFILLCICCTNAQSDFEHCWKCEHFCGAILFPFIIGLIFVIFLVLLVLYLQGIIHRIVYSFIPLWILELLGLIGACALACN